MTTELVHGTGFSREPNEAVADAVAELTSRAAEKGLALQSTDHTVTLTRIEAPSMFLVTAIGVGSPVTGGDVLPRPH